MIKEATAKELADMDSREVTEEDWEEDIQWLHEHGYMIVKREDA